MKKQYLFITLIAALMPSVLAAQDNDRKTDEKKTNSIPLDHYFVKPRIGSTPIRKRLKDIHFGAFTGLGYTFLNRENPALGIKGNGINFPLGIVAQYERKFYRVGVGYSFELMTGKSLTHHTSSIDFMQKYWLTLGGTFVRTDRHVYTADIRVGNYKIKSPASGLSTSLYLNVGVTMEREFSEYFKVFVRPSVDIKSYSLTNDATHQTNHYSAPAVYVNIGFTYSLPPLRKCFIKACHAQIDHAHGNREYRSRMHPFYKKQNPGYGENNPKLIKYKGINNRRMNPY